ncbi:DUF2975 domain-containing protein [Deefgea piscis]|uniref:DUF2975 domain-containing protein n=1 Tax=Deefgea piscis TaxID=2739061 RepID=A0A6M8SRQ8_9NEIS|nr:DUF2975 domain-containing protein [Deefgea piscis]QKJ66778.1 DUF2975 domain-containing protein [Deefgea piscis]
MTPIKMAQTSQKLAYFSLCLALTILLLNAAFWLFPTLAAFSQQAGLGFLLTERAQAYINPLTALPMWQVAGAIVLSSIPLLAMSFGLFHLRALFQTYARGDYFSLAAASHLGKVAHAAIGWAVLDFICSPLLILWVTMLNPVGQRVLSISLTPASLMLVFLGLSLSVIAHILQQASALATENQQFV